MTNLAMIDHVHRARWGCWFVLRPLLCTVTLATAVLLSGCVINLDGSSPEAGSGSSSNMGSDGSSTDMPTAPVNRLPEPSIGGLNLDLSLLSADQRAKLDEVGQYLFDHYHALGWQILATTAGTFGDVYDWLDPNSMEGSQKEPPPTPTPEEMRLPDGIQLQRTELDVFSELRGPEGSIPVLRILSKIKFQFSRHLGAIV